MVRANAWVRAKAWVRSEAWGRVQAWVRVKAWLGAKALVVRSRIRMEQTPGNACAAQMQFASLT